MSLKRLPPSTVKLISSTQVITSVSSVVKELIENSLDAGATNIEVKLENHGLDRIEVKDNGAGVKKEDVQYMCQKSYTSKINSFDDLYKLSTYGFRGEALNSLCAVAKVSITTISEGDDVAMTYEFNNDGSVVSSKLSHIIKGTSVVIENLFKNLPVRKQFLTNGRRKMDEIKKVEQVVKTLAVIHPKLRVVLTHNKFCIWQKNCVSTLRQSLVQIIAPTIVKQLTDINFESKGVSFDLLIPARGCNIASTCYGNPGDATFLFINLRPIKNKTIEKMVQDEIFNYFGHEILLGKYPTCLISIKLPPENLDVNLEPNKTRVIIKDMDEICNILKKEIILYYVGPVETSKEFLTAIDEEVEKNSVKRKNNGNEKPEKKLKLEEQVAYMEDGDDLDECNKPDVQPVNDNKGEAENDKGNKTALSISERDNNISAFFEGIDDAKNTLNSEESEVEKSIVAEDDLFLESQPCIELENNTTDKNLPEMNIAGPTVGDINIDSITLSQWSRGDIKLGGETVESSIVVLNNVMNNKAETTPIVNVDVFTPTDEVEVLTQERSVSSQMGCKDMAGFTKFASEMTNKITKNGEAVSFTKVAGELASKWRQLNDTDKEMYLERAKQKQKEKEDKANASMRERLQKFLDKCNERREVKKRRYPKELLVDVSLEELKASINKRPTNVNSSKDLGFRFVGELNDDIKCCAIESELYVFSTRRLQESLLFFKHLKTMIVPLKVLESGIIVNKEVLGDSLWSVLVGMETAIDVKSGSVIISNERISKNGFRLELVKGEPSVCSFLITDVALHTAFYGLEDLKEILSLIESSSSDLSLEDCRPLKILSYIRGETIRFISRNDIDTESERIIDEFRYWLENIKPKTKRCPHQKAVFKRIDLKAFIA